MTTKAELKKQIEELQAEYAAMPDEPQPLFEVAGYDQKYWFVDELLELDSYLNDNSKGDKQRLDVGNYFTDKAEAERMAAFIRKNFLYWRMALRFADGYEFKGGGRNGYVYEDSGETIKADYVVNCKDLGVIYMTFKNAERFSKFCNEHKKELGL